MNRIKDDKGNIVPAWGAPASIARMKSEYPKLIEQINNLYWSAYECHGKAVDEAIDMIRQAGITTDMETASVLMASEYKNETTDSVTGIVMRFTCNRKNTTGGMDND